ncbi:MAG: sulfite exporter TauE/SafE family protein [Sphingopyxis sp.]|uniref:sulfite exporter TauE/SafE family protein n=1 Tax=Sphingopyxis sp. TaxID=1908224 RepID=UPI001A4D438B|nr:sulfite exporter TauE/SafE family protein [Sphingopyxis sp.]MBL9069586.1 sulfite exporter TauE/SafE family protein [Sphingopyxis sp.]
MSLLADPATLAVLIVAVILLGMAKGGLAGVGALATPLVALVLPPATAAALLLPILIVQDVISVWSFRQTWDGWIIAWMLPGAAIGVAAGWYYAERVNEAQLMAALGAITLAFGLYRLWIERGQRVPAASQSPGWVGTIFGAVTGLTSQIAHAGGPPFQMWVTPRKLPHLVFIGTSSILFAIINWMKVPAYLALGAFPHEVVVAALLLMPLAIVSTLLTVRWLKRMDPARFYGIIYGLMVLLGAKLFWDGVSG